MGRLNKRALLRQLQKAGTASRADLAKSLGMSQPTAGKIADELLASGVLEEVVAADESNGTRLGRPGRRLQLNRTEPRFLGIQLGIQETKLTELALGGTGEDLWQISFANAKSQPARKWEQQLRAAAKGLAHKKFWGVLLSLPGIVDEPANRMLFSPNVHWSEQANLARIVGRIWKAPVLLVQEERALALGHQLANPDCENFLLVDFGEGVGGAIILQGKLYTNPTPIHGELGHTPVLGNRRRCGCGAVGCVETLVSTGGLLESFSAARPDRPKTWAALKSHIEERGVEPWLALSLDAAAVAIAGALNVLGLKRVVVTGSLTELPPAVMAHLACAVENGAMWARFGKVECLAAPRRRTAGLLAVGIDQLIVPDARPDNVHAKKFHTANTAN